VRLEGLGKLKKSTSSGTRTDDLPACSIVPQPTTLPRAPERGGEGVLNADQFGFHVLHSMAFQCRRLMDHMIRNWSNNIVAYLPHASKVEPQKQPFLSNTRTNNGRAGFTQSVSRLRPAKHMSTQEHDVTLQQ
jgi:hypothetical protein